MQGYTFKNSIIIINRELTQLDLFVKKFINILKKYSDYLIVSGFVSICTGRARGTEDVDIIVPQLNKDKFEKLFEDLGKNDFWCYQGDTFNEAYSYIENLQNIRFAQKNELFPNIEFVSFTEKNIAKTFEFNHPQKIKIKDFEFEIPPIEFEILYKEIVLKGKKDIEDARHLRVFFSKILKKEKFEEYKSIIKNEIKN